MNDDLFKVAHASPMTRGTAPPEWVTMTNDTTEPPAMREGDCPYCERTVLSYEEPPRCPMCACPLDTWSLRPFTFPPDRAVAPEE